ncbi:MAG TPA: inosine/xanthosine triphosphatase [Anaerolineales bacterium]|nr:inosine/xanthosine triphosphatase [Anaerolineales bacterium]
MKPIIVASSNPVKINAVQAGFDRVFGAGTHRAEGRVTPSGVSAQPMTDTETLAGARNRAVAAKEAHPDADFWAGVEGGVEDGSDGMLVFAWIVVLGDDLAGEARTGAFLLPPEVARLVREGVELGEADDIVFGRTNSKQEDGAVGILTGGLIDREGYYEQAVVLALIPFMNTKLYLSG